jgi:hypothetical protein
MNIDLFIAMIATIYFITVPAFSSVAGRQPSLSQIQNPRQTRTYRCLQPSDVPLPALYKPLQLKQSWCGTVQKETRLANPAKKYITNDLEWTRLWRAYRGNEALPKVNFGREIILAYVHFDANAVEMIPALSDTGNLVIGVSFTEAGMADSPCTYMFSSVDRRGIKTIDGKVIGNNSKRNSTGY